MTEEEPREGSRTSESERRSREPREGSRTSESERRSREPRLTPIGVVHSSYETPDDAPHQGFAGDEEATVEVFPEYADALAGIDGIHRLTVLYWAHLADRDALVGDDGGGAFTRRGPSRPNPINICTCMVMERNGRRLRLRGLDAVDGSPVLDIKPALQGEL